MIADSKEYVFSILISTKNRCSELLFTLDKIKTLIDRADVHCVVFDDGSEDETSTMVKKHFPQVELLRNDVSKGYLYCRNKMLNDTSAQYAISLDDDAHFLSDDPLEIIKDHFIKEPNCAVIACRIFWGKTAPENLHTKQNRQQVKSFVGCGHVWNIAAWKNVRNYPEWFEFYGEEDFSGMQLSKKGYTVDYIPEILVQHRVDLKTRSVQEKDAAIRYRRGLRSGWYLYFLFYPTAKIPRKMAYSLGLQLKNKILKGNFAVAVPILQALGDVIKNFPRMLKERNAFSHEDYKRYMELGETKVYWNPEK